MEPGKKDKQRNGISKIGPMEQKPIKILYQPLKAKWYRMKEAQQKAKPMLGKHHSKETLEKFKYRKNGMKGKIGKDNPNSKPVAMLDINENIIKTFANSLIVLQQYGIDRGSICRCCNGTKNCWRI